MEDKKILKWKEAKLYLIVIGCLIAIIAYYQPVLALICAIALAYLIYHYIKVKYWVWQAFLVLDGPN